MATATRKSTTRNAATPKAAGVRTSGARKATPKAVAAPKADVTTEELIVAAPKTRKAAAPKAAGTRGGLTTVRKSSAAKAATERVTSARKAAPKAVAAKATKASAAKADETTEEKSKYAWGAEVFEPNYVWLTAEAKKASIGKIGRRSLRINRTMYGVLVDMVESGKWWDGSRRLRKAEVTGIQDVIAQYDEGTEWMVRDPKTGERKGNGYKQTRAEHDVRLLVVTIHAERSAARRGESARVVDPKAFAEQFKASRSA